NGTRHHLCNRSAHPQPHRDHPPHTGLGHLPRPDTGQTPARTTRTRPTTDHRTGLHHRHHPGLRLRSGTRSRTPRPPTGRPLRIPGTDHLDRDDRGHPHLRRHAGPRPTHHHRPRLGHGRKHDHPQRDHRPFTPDRRTQTQRPTPQPHRHLHLPRPDHPPFLPGLCTTGLHRRPRLLPALAGRTHHRTDPVPLPLLPLPTDKQKSHRLQRNRPTSPHRTRHNPNKKPGHPSGHHPAPHRNTATHRPTRGDRLPHRAALTPHGHTPGRRTRTRRSTSSTGRRPHRHDRLPARIDHLSTRRTTRRDPTRQQPVPRRTGLHTRSDHPSRPPHRPPHRPTRSTGRIPHQPAALDRDTDTFHHHLHRQKSHSRTRRNPPRTLCRLHPHHLLLTQKTTPQPKTPTPTTPPTPYAPAIPHQMPTAPPPPAPTAYAAAQQPHPPPASRT